MFSTIRIKLTLSYLAVIILAMGLSGFLLLSFLERYFLEATADSLMTQAQITAQMLIPGAIPQGPPGEIDEARANRAAVYNTIQQQRSSNLSLQTDNVLLPTEDLSLSNTDLTYLTDASLQFSAQLETRIRILNNQGVVLVDSLQQQQGQDLAGDTLVSQALNGQYAQDSDSKSDLMYLAMPILTENQLVGVIYLSQPLSDVTSVLSDLRTRWLISTLIALLLSGSVGLLLSQAIASPLRRLTIAAGIVAQGQFDQQVPVRSNDELGHLSRAFNEMTARLQAARQMQIYFVANVSHELRTPLTSIKGLVETLRLGAVDDLEVRDHFLETVEDETDRLIRLVNDLLILSRADSEALNLGRKSGNLADMAQTCLLRLGPLAENQEVSLKLEADPKTPLVWADLDRIEQVLVNLLDNAIKFSKPGGVVTLSLEPGPDQMVLVQVRDQGIGIPLDDLSRIGQRFYRVDKARSRTEGVNELTHTAGGSGLGLAIAQTLVLAHEGKLWVESQEGWGTVVSFTLPTV